MHLSFTCTCRRPINERPMNAGDKDNKAFMTQNCPHSCQMCPMYCRDVEEACEDWAKNGHCESNPTYMLKTCGVSCGVCAPKCYDKDDEGRCGDWARKYASGSRLEL